MFTAYDLSENINEIALNVQISLIFEDLMTKHDCNLL